MYQCACTCTCVLVHVQVHVPVHAGNSSSVRQHTLCVVLTDDSAHAQILRTNFNRRAFGKTTPRTPRHARVATQYQYIQTAAKQQDQDAQATADMNEGAVQATEETTEQATLTDVSNTTGTRTANAQTEFAMTDVGQQHAWA